MMKTTIRRAVAADCSRMLELVQELAAYENAAGEVTIDVETFCQSGFGPNPVWWAFVAEVEGHIVAFALYYIRFSTWKGERMYLEDIITTQAFRGKGIGAGLMEALIAEARLKNYSAICWQVLEWNKPAINFYKKYNARFDGEWLNVVMDV